MTYELYDTQEDKKYEIDDFEELKEWLSDLLSEEDEGMPTEKTMRKIEKAKNVRKLVKVLKGKHEYDNYDYYYKIKEIK